MSTYQHTIKTPHRAPQDGSRRIKTMSHIKPATKCKDGTSLSVQSSKYHYCTPREDDMPYYSAVEVGFIQKDKEPVTPPDSWHAYGDGTFPSDVYGYVPIGLVEALIEEHGGREQDA